MQQPPRRTPTHNTNQTLRYAPPPSLADAGPCALVEVRRCRFIDADAEPDAADGPVRAAGDSRVFDGIELIVDARGRFPAAILGRPALFLRDELWGAPDARFLSSRSPRFSVWTLS